MPDENVDGWKPQGSLYFWRYLENSRNFPGWHLTADTACCLSLDDLIQRMLKAQWSSKKSLLVTAPTERVLKVPNNRGGEARIEAPHTLTLSYPKGNVSDDYFALEQTGNEIVLTAGSEKLELLRECVTKIPEGEGDYAINVGETSLWFWWMLK